MHIVEETAHKLIDAVANGNSQELEILFSEDCKVHLPFKLNYTIDLEGKKEVLDYFKKNFNCPTSEKITNRKSVMSDENHVVVNFKGHRYECHRKQEFDYCVFCEVTNGKINELYAII